MSSTSPPLDPAARKLIDAIDKTFPRVETLTGAEARRQVRAFQESWPVDLEPVDRVEDRRIPGPAGDIPVRIYWPAGPTSRGPLPALVYVHGGGWVICDLDTYEAMCRIMANRVGCVIVSVDYRLAPEHPFPAAADDAYAATRWVAEHATELGADPRRVGVGGDSAGGNLAAVCALMARDRGGPALVFQLLIYPVTDCSFDTTSYRDNAQGYYLEAVTMRWYWRQYLGDGADGANPYASPLRAPDLSQLPPALVITAGYDPLRDEGEAYGRRLQEAGVDTKVSRYETMFHGFFGFGPLLDAALPANEEAFAALRGAFRTG
jgi:acetyl esterase